VIDKGGKPCTKMAWSTNVHNHGNVFEQHPWSNRHIQQNAQGGQG
jgi:hypothetical protein